MNDEQTAPDQADATEVGGEPQPSETPAQRKDNVTFAWLLALLPVLLAPIDYFAPHVSDARWFWYGCIALVTSLVLQDIQELAKRGIRLSKAWILFSPGFLIARTIKAKSTVAIPIACFASFAISFAVIWSVPMYDFDGASTETSIEEWYADNDTPGVTVSCPSQQDVYEGDEVWCTASNEYGDEVRVKVTIGDDGWWSWEANP